MIDSCDEAIACWSEDGETFVVKDPQKFERTIIPQFFKHSKFSSFVRVRAGCGSGWSGEQGCMAASLGSSILLQTPASDPF